MESSKPLDSLGMDAAASTYVSSEAGQTNGVGPRLHDRGLVSPPPAIRQGSSCRPDAKVHGSNAFSAMAFQHLRAAQPLVGGAIEQRDHGAFLVPAALQDYHLNSTAAALEAFSFRSSKYVCSGES